MTSHSIVFEILTGIDCLKW